MKKFFVLILSLVYLSSSVGATVHLHYCMDRLIGWGIAGDDEDTCSKCGMEKKAEKKCCKDEAKQVKLKVDQKVPQTMQTLLQPVVLTSFMLGDGSAEERLLSRNHLHPQSHAPPLISGTAVYLRNRVFLI